MQKLLWRPLHESNFLIIKNTKLTKVTSYKDVACCVHANFADFLNKIGI